MLSLLTCWVIGRLRSDDVAKEVTVQLTATGCCAEISRQSVLLDRKWCPLVSKAFSLPQTVVTGSLLAHLSTTAVVVRETAGTPQGR